MINRARGDIRRPAAASSISGTGDWAAPAVSFGIAGFLVDAVGWRPVYLGGGLVDIACAVTLAVSLRWTPWRPAEPGPVPRAAEP
jgi:MFS family permease